MTGVLGESRKYSVTPQEIDVPRLRVQSELLGVIIILETCQSRVVLRQEGRFGLPMEIKSG